MHFHSAVKENLSSLESGINKVVIVFLIMCNVWFFTKKMIKGRCGALLDRSRFKDPAATASNTVKTLFAHVSS